jgi:hypothetical protein
MTPAEYASDLSRTYERLHTAKEDAFWTSYMGLADDVNAAQKDLDTKEIEVKRFLQDPQRLKKAREELSRAGREGAPGAVRTALEGWIRTLDAHVMRRGEPRLGPCVRHATNGRGRA